MTVERLLAAAVDAIPGGITRPGQVEMATAIEAAFEERQHLLVQAGTGTGKSLGYLVPVLASGRRAIVATATIALQSQLVTSDLPRLAATTASILGRTPTFALLKGRQHYACRAKLDAEEADDLLSDGLTWVGELGRLGAAVTRVREWAVDTKTGDRADLDPGVDDKAWLRASMSARECVGANRCRFGADCFAELAKAKAREADIVVTNHALLAVDILQGGGVLPPHDVLIIDEAHEITHQVTNAARAEVAPAAVNALTRRAGISADAKAHLARAAESLSGALVSVDKGRLRPVPPALVTAATLVAAACRDAAASIGPAGADDSDALTKNQTKQALRDVVEVADRIAADTDADVVWVDDEADRLSVVVDPLSVAGLLGAKLYEERTVVFTSATLAPGGRFETVAGDVGLARDATDSWRGLDVGSPFDYPKQGILYIAAHLPRPAASGLAPALAAELVELVTAAGGRTLGLFSSRKAAEAATAELRAKTDLEVLSQGEDSLSNLVARFRDNESSCLIGVASLWQGVDVPGPACQLVVIDRLPFPRPDDPLLAARSAAVDKAGGSGFMGVSVPHAAIRLAQGAGRLIRAADDRGVVAILDSRLATARYGDFIRRTLPPLWSTTDPAVVRSALRRLSGSFAASGAVD